MCCGSKTLGYTVICDVSTRSKVSYSLFWLCHCTRCTDMFRPLFLEYKLQKKKQIKRNVIKNADSDGNGCPLSWCVYMYESGCLSDSFCYIIFSLHNRNLGCLRFFTSWCWCLVHIGYFCVNIILLITCPTSFGGRAGTKLSPIPLDLLYPVFIFSFFFHVISVGCSDWQGNLKMSGFSSSLRVSVAWN